MIPPVSSSRSWFQEHEEEQHKQANVLFNLQHFTAVLDLFPSPFPLPPETICLSSALFLTAQLSPKGICVKTTKEPNLVTLGLPEPK